MAQNNVKQLHALFKNAPAAIAIFDGPKHKFVMANKAYQKQNNRSEKELLGRTFSEVFPELFNTESYKLLDNVFKTGQTFTASEFSVMVDKTNNGIPVQCYFNFSLEALKNDSGEIYGLIVMALDITEQVLGQKKIIESEKRFRDVVEQATFPMLVLKGENWIIELANDPILKLWNVGKEVIGKSILTVTPEIKDQPFGKHLSNVVRNGVTHHGHEEAAYYIRENGEKDTHYFNYVYQPYYEDEGNITGVIVTASDVTEQVLARKKIEASEQRYYALFMNSPFAFSIMKGKDMQVVIANSLMKEFWGKGTDVEGKTLLEILPELIDQPFPAMIDSVYTSGIPVYANEMLAKLNRNGKMEDKFFNIVYEPHLEADGTISGVITIAHEVTHQVLARKKIEESEQRFQAAIVAVQGVLWTNNANGEMEGKQLGWEALTGQNYDAYQGYGWANAVHPEDAYATIAAWNEAVRERKNFVFEHRVQLKNGTWGHFSVKAIPLLNEDGSIREWVGVHTDITLQKNAIQKIEESEYQYQNLIYTSPYMIAIFKGRELIIEIANDAIIETWGKGKDIIGKSFFELLPEAVEQGFDKLILNVFETGEPYNAYETPITLLRNGKQELMHYNFVYQAHRNVYGRIVGVAILANEVTPQVQDKQKIIESETRFRLLADNMPLNVFVADATLEDNITYLNKYWLNFTKQTFSDATANGWFSFVHPDDIEMVKNVYEPAFKKREAYTIPNFRIKRHDGEYRWFTFQAIPRYLPNGEFEGYMGISFDINEQKLFELELIEQKIKAENAVKSKQQFLSNMSHEIRTPLNSILGFTNVLMKTNLGDQQTEYVQAIKTSGKSLNLLINDILDLAKVDAGKMTFEKEPFEIRKTVNSILHSFDLNIKEKNLKLFKDFDNNIPNILLGDSLRLNQILLNLLSNAVKFTHKGKIEVNVNLKHEDRNHATIEFIVTDSGIGIDIDKIDAVFKPFEQAETSTSNSYGGTGLGLAIVKQLIESQGGKIGLISKLGEGSTFNFTLPFGKTKIKTENVFEITTVVHSNVKNLRILVAEDVTLNQLLIKIILNDFGFAHEVVENGKIAIEKMQTDSYDIILMDMQMPVMNGFEATEYIRNTLKSQIPIIALTADVTTIDVAKCKEYGMDDYISKPIDEKLLYNKIVELVNMKK